MGSSAVRGQAAFEGAISDFQRYGRNERKLRRAIPLEARYTDFAISNAAPFCLSALFGRAIAWSRYVLIGEWLPTVRNHSDSIS
jgi:hypothetical protein